MGLIKKFLIFTVFVAIFAVLYQKYFTKPLKLPEIENKWFGKTKLKTGEPFPKDPVAINKFTVNVSNEVLEDLRRRLELSRFVQPLPETKFNYGFNSDYLKTVVEYWKKSFDWRKQEIKLNQFNQYKTQINGINVHFLHIKPTKPAKTVVPLMLIHGWPGSVWEYYKAIPLLTEPTNGIAFEVICPSIPGYGFSDAPQQEGFDVITTTGIFVKLMDRLGHKKFFVGGGDWGAIISKTMSQLYPQNIRGLHLTMAMNSFKGKALMKLLVGIYFPSLVFTNPEKDYKKLYPISDHFYLILREMGYSLIQATKPDTIGTALMDSPVGLAAYILEKFSSWTNMNNIDKEDGGLTQKFTLDELLTNVMIYWISNNVASSLRYYKESMVPLIQSDLDVIPVPSTVPVAVADFPNELGHASRDLLGYQFNNLVQFNDMPRGGHFAAFEEPVLVSDDIKKFVKKVLDSEKK